MAGNPSFDLSRVEDPAVRELRDAFNKLCVNREPGTAEDLVDQFLRESISRGSLCIRSDDLGESTVYVPDSQEFREHASDYFDRAKSDLERSEVVPSSAPADQPDDEMRRTTRSQAAQAGIKPTELRTNGSYRVEMVKVSQETSESSLSREADSPGENESPPDLGWDKIRIPRRESSGFAAGVDPPGTVRRNTLRSDSPGVRSLSNSLGEGVRRKTLAPELAPGCDRATGGDHASGSATGGDHAFGVATGGDHASGDATGSVRVPGSDRVTGGSQEPGDTHMIRGSMWQKDDHRVPNDSDTTSDSMGWLARPEMGYVNAPMGTTAHPLSDSSQAGTWGAPRVPAANGVPLLSEGGNSQTGADGFGRVPHRLERPPGRCEFSDHREGSQTRSGCGNALTESLHSSVTDEERTWRRQTAVTVLQDLEEICRAPGFAEDREGANFAGCKRHYLQKCGGNQARVEWLQRSWKQWILGTVSRVGDEVSQQVEELVESGGFGVGAGQKPVETSHSSKARQSVIPTRSDVRGLDSNRWPPGCLESNRWLPRRGGGSSSRGTVVNPMPDDTRGGTEAQVLSLRAPSSEHVPIQQAPDKVGSENALRVDRADKDPGNGQARGNPTAFADSFLDSVPFVPCAGNVTDGGLAEYWAERNSRFYDAKREDDLARQHLQSQLAELSTVVTELRGALSIERQKTVDNRRAFEARLQQEREIRGRETSVLLEKARGEIRAELRDSQQQQQQERPPSSAQREATGGRQVPSESDGVGRAQRSESVDTSYRMVSSPLNLDQLRGTTPTPGSQGCRREDVLRDREKAPVRQNQPRAGALDDAETYGIRNVCMRSVDRQVPVYNRAPNGTGTQVLSSTPTEAPSSNSREYGSDRQTPTERRSDAGDNSGRQTPTERRNDPGGGSEDGTGSDRTGDRSGRRNPSRRDNERTPPNRDGNSGAAGGGGGGGGDSSDAGDERSDEDDYRGRRKRNDSTRNQPPKDKRDRLSFTDVYKLTPMFGCPTPKRSWESYLAKFLKLCEDNDIDPNSRINILFHKLEGDAEVAVEDLDASDQRDFDKVVSCLNKTFVKHQDSEDAGAVLERRVQKPGETIEQFGKSINELARIAHPVDKIERRKALHRRLKFGLSEPTMRSRFLDHLISHKEWTVEDHLDDLKLHDPRRVIGGVKPDGTPLLPMHVTDTLVDRGGLGASEATEPSAPVPTYAVSTPGSQQSQRGNGGGRGGYRGGRFRQRNRGYRNRGGYGGPVAPEESQQNAGQDTINQPRQAAPSYGGNNSWRANTPNFQPRSGTRGQYDRFNRGRGVQSRPGAGQRGTEGSRDTSNDVCFRCGQRGHWARTHDDKPAFVLHCHCVRTPESASPEVEDYVSGEPAYMSAPETGN